jgi:hypothetical protein
LAAVAKHVIVICLPETKLPLTQFFSGEMGRQLAHGYGTNWLDVPPGYR